jgi:hypothetical protein
MGRESFQGAEALVPDRKTLPVLRNAVQKCKGCNLLRYATQAVIGKRHIQYREFVADLKKVREVLREIP